MEYRSLARRAAPLLGAVAVTLATAVAAQAPPPFPSGFDWPANPATLEAAVAAGNASALRQHGWYLWAGLNTTTSAGPVWAQWPTTSQVFPQPPPAPRDINRSKAQAHGLLAANLANRPINLNAPVYPPPVVSGGKCATGNPSGAGLPDGKRFQSNGDIMIASVVYNGDAAAWIASAGLADATTLTTEWNQGNGDKQIAPFPAKSIALKHMYWPVQGEGLTALPVWDPQSYPASYPDYIGYEYWKRIVVIDPSGKPTKPGLTGVANYLFHIFEYGGKKPLGPNLKTGSVVSINDFYYERLDAYALAALSAADRAILDASACWLFNRPFKAGDILATIASHINTKEIPTWGLQSVWWHDKPDVGPFSKDRPTISSTKAPGPWRHYLLTSEYGIEASSGLLPVAFNPYIELAAAHPIQTNCRNCHIRAAWPRGGAVPGAPASASYEATGGPGALVGIDANNTIFDQLMLLDFQWAVSDRAQAPAAATAQK